VLLPFMIQLIHEAEYNFFNKFNCGHRIFTAEITGDNLKADFIFYFNKFFIPNKNEIQTEIILVFNLFIELKTRLNANFIAGKIIDKLIIDNNNN
jgi:hypothetical protein